MARILIADDQEIMRDSLAEILTRAKHEIVAAGDGQAAVERLTAGQRFDLLITDMRMPRLGGMELLTEAKRLRPDLPVIVMTAYASIETAVAAMKQGAYDYLQKPFDAEAAKMLVERAIEHSRLKLENAALRTMAEGAGPRPLIGSSAVMAEIRKQIDRVAQSAATVLIRGESGTGKEVVARAIHYASPRRERPFLAVNCAALSENLLESELFGHEKGAFTGADKMRRGRFELADGGTLLLDEISEIAPPLQAKLLRVLQEAAFERVGSSVTQQVDVRVVATSNRDLEAEVAAARFRGDLFYRLNVVPIELAPLRERAEDVPELARHFLHRCARRDNSATRHIEPDALRLLQKYHWPGNVRELQNIVERATVLEVEPGRIRASTLEPWLRAPTVETGVGADGIVVDGLAGKPLAEIEKKVILSTLDKFKGHRIKTASALGIGVRTLGMKLKKWREEGEPIEVAA
jgi:DNA-binding NtrC family response regulator